MANINSSITWNSPTTGMWRLSANQSATDSNNLGIAGSPYVYKAYLSLQTLQPLLQELSETEPSMHLSLVAAHIHSLSEYIRPALPSDLSLDNNENLASKILSKITINPYVSSDNPANPLTYTKIGTDGSSAQEEVSVALDYSRLARSTSTEHSPLDGWYYYRYFNASEDYFVYDSAKKALDNLEYFLGWKAKQSSGNTYLPLTAGLLSVIPSAREFSVGATSASGLLAGDFVKISVSGGSGEYTVLPTSGSESIVSLESDNSWRLLENNSSSVLQITDNNIAGEQAYITLTTTEPN